MATAAVQQGGRPPHRGTAGDQGRPHRAIVRDTGELKVVQMEGFLVDKRVPRVIIPHHDTVIEENDHVVVFCTRKREVPQVEKLFQVGFQFL
jgi:NhaP-type Na+/H+ and K+/H+ antiporter